MLHEHEALCQNTTNDDDKATGASTETNRSVKATGLNFAQAAPLLSQAGLIVLPVRNKRPCVKGFNKWKKQNPRTIRELGERFADADTTILTRASGLAVVDYDDDEPSLITLGVQECGESRCWIGTRRGFHCYYKNPKRCLGGTASGFDIDLKAGGPSDYVVAPVRQPYKLAKGPNSLKRFIALLNRAPPISMIGVKRLFGPVTLAVYGCSSGTRQPAPYSTAGPIKQGARNSTLWRLAMDKARQVSAEFGFAEAGWNALMDFVKSVNDQQCSPPLGECEIASIARSAWGYEKSGRNVIVDYPKAGGDACLRHPICLRPELVGKLLVDPYAFHLLAWLRSVHGNRGMFPLSREGLKKMLGWTEYHVRHAKKKLVEIGLVRKVKCANRHKHQAELFTFNDW